MLQTAIEKIEKWVEKLQTVPVEFLYPTRKRQTELISEIEAQFNLDVPIDRSYSQYLAQSHLLSNKQRLFLSLISFTTIAPFLFTSICRYYFALFFQSTQHMPQSKNIAVFYEATDEVLPESLLIEFDCKIRKTGSFLCFKDLFEIFKVAIRHPKSIYFTLKIAYKIAHYRYNYFIFQPKAMICCSEYSFASSYLTQWCFRNGLEHINIMHGEKLYHLVDTFAEFHRFYVWNEFYLELVKTLKCNSKKFYIEIPKKFKNFSQLAPQSNKFSITCFLQTRDLTAWNNLADHLKKINSKYDVIIRPHPRWLGRLDVEKIFGAFKIENPNNVDIMESFSKTNCICSGYSTVLFLGHLADREVIVDDISNPFLFNRLKELDFGVLQRPHKLLSEI
jgi:hypothetical protein